MTRSRIQTRQKILNAVETLLLEQGYPAVGINAIARQAGCDKVLIYRYFGGFDGLLLAFAETTQLWWTVDEVMSESAQEFANLPLPQYLQTLLKRHASRLQAMPVTLEIMAWEMSEQNNLTIALGRTRAESGMALIKKIRTFYPQPGFDIGGILGVFGAAINYLVIRTRKSPPQHMKEEWWRLQQTIAGMLNNYS